MIAPYDAKSSDYDIKVVVQTLLMYHRAAAAIDALGYDIKAANLEDSHSIVPGTDWEGDFQPSIFTEWISNVKNGQRKLTDLRSRCTRSAMDSLTQNLTKTIS